MRKETQELRFFEVQREGWTWFRITALILALLVWSSVAKGLLAGFDRGWIDFVLQALLVFIAGLWIPATAFFLRVETLVYGEVLELRRIALLSRRTRTIDVHDIVSTDIISVYPAIDQVAWATSASGPRGVRVKLQAGESLIVASTRPEDLSSALAAHEAMATA